MNFIGKFKELSKEKKIKQEEFPEGVVFDPDLKKGYIRCLGVELIGELYVSFPNLDITKTFYLKLTGGLTGNYVYETNNYIKELVLGNIFYIELDEYNKIIDLYLDETKSEGLNERIRNYINIHRMKDEINTYSILDKTDQGYVVINKKNEKVLLDDKDSVSHIDSINTDGADKIYVILLNKDNKIVIKDTYKTHINNYKEEVLTRVEVTKEVKLNIDKKENEENVIFEITDFKSLGGIFNLNVKKENGESLNLKGRRYLDLISKNDLMIGDVIEISKTKNTKGITELNLVKKYRDGVLINKGIDMDQNNEKKLSEKELTGQELEPITTDMDDNPFSSPFEVLDAEVSQRKVFKNKPRIK